MYWLCPALIWSKIDNRSLSIRLDGFNYLTASPARLRLENSDCFILNPPRLLGGAISPRYFNDGCVQLRYVRSSFCRVTVTPRTQDQTSIERRKLRCASRSSLSWFMQPLLPRPSRRLSLLHHILQLM